MTPSNPPADSRGAHFDTDHQAVVITDITLRDKDVTREAFRWTTGERGPVVDDPATLDDADLGAFVEKAITIGAHALSATGQAAEAQAIERMITDLGQKATQSTTDAAEVTSKAVATATEAVTKAAGDAQKAFREAEAASRKSLNESVTAARAGMEAEMKRLFGGTNPEVVDRFAPLMTKFAADLEKQASSSTTELLTKAAKQFDPSDPSSPMAKHAAELTTRQEKLTERIDKQHNELSEKIDALSTAIKVETAKTELAKVTPIKGESYAAGIHEVLTSIATALGAEYTDTGAIVGAVPRSKKGDGVLTIDDGVARVVIEMTDSKRNGWSDYLDEAERNRQAGASLGLVRTAEQNCGETVRVLGKRRIVMAFDPTTDDAELLRTVMLLLKASASSVASRAGALQIATAEEKIEAAVQQLGKIEEIKKTAGTIQKSALKIETSCTGVATEIERLLGDALAALATVDDGVTESNGTRGAA